MLRLAGVDAATPGLDRAEEARLQGEAAAAGLAPTPRFSDPAAGILVSDYLAPGPAPAPAAALAARGALLRAVHALRAPPRPLELGSYLERCEHRARTVDAGLARRARALLPVLALPGDRAVLCHNDLRAANRLWHGGRLLALDWEYAALGNRWFDLAAGAADLDDALALLRAYRGTGANDPERRAVTAAFALSRYVDALWYTLQGRPPAAAWAAAARALENAHG